MHDKAAEIVVTCIREPTATRGSTRALNPSPGFLNSFFRGSYLCLDYSFRDLGVVFKVPEYPQQNSPTPLENDGRVLHVQTPRIWFKGL